MPPIVHLVDVEVSGAKNQPCKHGDDPGCLIRSAVINGDIDEARYESYHKIIDSMDDKRPTYSKS